MLQKDIEARIKDYPNLIKEENNRLTVLKTALANLNKTHQSECHNINPWYRQREGSQRLSPGACDLRSQQRVLHQLPLAVLVSGFDAQVRPRGAREQGIEGQGLSHLA